MAGLPWFKVFSNIVAHPKTRALEEATSNPEALAYIVRLLSWFNEYAPSGRADGARTARALERACEWRGADGALITALLDCGWLDRDGEALVMHDWDDVQGSHLAKASKDAERKKIQRLAQKAARDAERAALDQRADGARTARGRRADGARTARVEESRGEEKRAEEIDGSGAQPPATPLPGGPEQGSLAIAVTQSGRKAAPREPPKEPPGPVHHLRQRHAAVWVAEGRAPLGLPVRRSPKAGEDPIDYSREGQLWNQALGHARVAGAGDDAAAVELVLKRLAHAAHLTRNAREGGGWVERPRVSTLSEFVEAFHDAATPPKKRPPGAQVGHHVREGTDFSGFTEEEITGFPSRSGP